ncbi:RnfH family protein [Lysobacter sp. FW306-1B-D06B]|uniref:RnfH family protein n=1 Tax=unclassified Lysobacter TaxID=2635362 RepID=UPI001C22EC50|nr:RnfH family protein [Lysobacter sp. MMG2]
MRIEVVRAWPRRFEAVSLELPDGATVAQALAATGWGDDDGTVGHAVFGVRVAPDTVLHDGDRLELLRALQADPKDARRRRAESKTKPRP